MNNVREFLQRARRWVNVAYANDVEILRALNPLFSQENFGKIVTSGLPRRPSDSERRTFGNYLNAAARTMALRLESIVPEFFIESPSRAQDTRADAHGIASDERPLTLNAHHVQVGLPNQVERLASYMCKSTGWLSGLRHESVPVSAYLERPLVFQSLR